MSGKGRPRDGSNGIGPWPPDPKPWRELRRAPFPNARRCLTSLQPSSPHTGAAAVVFGLGGRRETDRGCPSSAACTTRAPCNMTTRLSPTMIVFVLSRRTLLLVVVIVVANRVDAQLDDPCKPSRGACSCRPRPPLSLSLSLRPAMQDLLK